jgi:PAS domain-containing protein
VPFQASRGAVVAFNASLQYVLVSDEAATALGTTADALLGRHCWDMFPQCEHTPLGVLMRDVLAHRLPGEIRTPVHGSADQDIIARVVPTPDGGIRLLFRFVTRVEMSQPMALAQTATGTS